MKSTVPEQATWVTSDASAWWLRDASYTQPSGDYEANCYMDLWHNPANENSITFDDGNCEYHSRSYYCQPIKTTTTTTTTAGITITEAEALLKVAIEKGSASKQLLTLEAGRLEYLADYLTARATQIGENSDLGRRGGGVTNMMKIATDWAEEVKAGLADARAIAAQLVTRIEEGEYCIQNELKNDNSLAKAQEETENIDKLIPQATAAFDTMMTHQDLISPRLDAADTSTYSKITGYFDASKTDVPTTCSGPSVVKPIAGKSYAECAAACNAQNENCIAFTFFPSKMCFLHRKITGMTSYTGCNTSFVDASDSADDQTRLSCVVKSAEFVAQHPEDTRADSIKWKEVGTYCPVYDDEGVTFATPITLTALAFKEGSYIISAPGVYELTEDVSFHPETTLSSGVSSSDVTFPDPTSEMYPQLGGYFLGFFAAIVVQADNVTIDCKGFEIEMSLEYHRRQRYFAIIELGSKPFNSGTGPPQLANSLLTTAEMVSPNNVVIQNCNLGRSAHHGIHGNSPQGVTIKNTNIKDFEVGGIHFNGASNVDIQNVKIGPSHKETYQAYLSQSNFIDHLMNSLMPMNPEINVHRKDAKVTIKGVEHAVHDVFMTLHTALHAFYESGVLTDLPIFRDTGSTTDPTGLPDGSAVYGIVIHKTDPAAGDFGSCTLEDAIAAGTSVSDIKIDAVTIDDLSVDVRQITRLLLDGNQVMGPAGDVFDFDRITNDDDHYVGTLLSDAQLAVGAFKAYLADKVDADILTYFFGATHMPSSILDWAAKGNEAYADSSASAGTEFSCFGDSMSHANKGAVGFFANHITSGDIGSIVINYVANTGEVDADPTKCVHADYKGADSRGVAVVNCAEGAVNLNGVAVGGVTSAHGAAIEKDDGGLDTR